MAAMSISNMIRNFLWDGVSYSVCLAPHQLCRRLFDVASRCYLPFLKVLFQLFEGSSTNLVWAESVAVIWSVTMWLRGYDVGPLLCMLRSCMLWPHGPYAVNPRCSGPGWWSESEANGAIWPNHRGEKLKKITLRCELAYRKNSHTSITWRDGRLGILII